MSKEIDLTKLTPEELIKLIQEKESDLQEFDKVVVELKKDLAKKDNEVTTVGGAPTLKSGRDSYLIAIHAFNFEGKKYTTADLLTNDKLVAALIKIGSGVLVKL